MKRVRGRLTILTDNAVPGKSDAIGEAGFSAFVETEAGSFLFDTGKGKTVVHNALVYKKDLRNINKIVLSHAHGDHTGGLPEVLPTVYSKQIDVFAHPDVFLERFRELFEDKDSRRIISNYVAENYDYDKTTAGNEKKKNINKRWNKER